MSGNELSALCDEQKMHEYIYDDVDDSDIFASELLNNSFTESDPRTDAELPIKLATAHNTEIKREKEALQETVEKLQQEKELLQLRISELYKTARAELDRKDRRLRDLEKEKDNIVFRRENNVRNKLVNVDPRVPVLQQVEKNLTNEEFQNFNVGYRIPKKKSTPSTPNDNDTCETGIKNDDKKLIEVRLENKSTQKEKYNSDDKHWSAYPFLKEEPTKHDIGMVRYKQKNVEENRSTFDDRRKGRVISPQGNFGKDCDENKDKQTKDNHIKDRSRPRERSNERCKPTFVQGRSKSFSRYIYVSPENQVKKPRSPSRERKDLSNTSTSKPVIEDIKLKDRRIYSNPTSREKEQTHMSRRRSRSPSNENNGLIKKSIRNKSQSLGRFQPSSPKYRVGQPRTPSSEREEELPQDPRRSGPTDVLKTKYNRIHHSPTSKEKEFVHSSRKRSKSKSKDEDFKPRYNRKHSTSASIEKEHDVRQINMLKSRDKNKMYSRNDSISPSREKEDTYTSHRKNRLHSQANPGNASRGEIEDRKVRNSRKKDIRTSNRGNKGLGSSSSGDKGLEDRKYSETSGSRNQRDKDRGSRDHKRNLDLREMYLRRSRSVSRDRDSRRPGFKRSRSISKERYLKKPPERAKYGGKQCENNIRNARNGRHLHRDKSKSSSVERDGGERFRHKVDPSVRRDRFGNVIKCNYRKNRNRSNSRDRPTNLNIGGRSRDGTSRPRDFARLRERVLRYSIDRENLALRNTSREDRSLDKDGHKNPNKKKAHIEPTDLSDLDDLKLHLSGESDLDSLNVENTKEHRDEPYNSEDEGDFKFVLELGVDPRTVTDAQLEMLLKRRTEVFNNDLSDDTDDQCKEVGKGYGDSNLEAQFSDPEEKLIESEEYDDTKQIQGKNSGFWHLENDDEELDYEVSKVTEELPHTKLEENKSRQFPRRIVQQTKEHFKNPRKEKVGKNGKNELYHIGDNIHVQQNEEYHRGDNIHVQQNEEYHRGDNIHVQQHWEERSNIEPDNQPPQTLYNVRMRQKLRDEIPVKLKESSKICRRNTQVPKLEGVNSVKENKFIFGRKEKPDEKSNVEKGNQNQIWDKPKDQELKYETNREGLSREKVQGTYSSVFEDVHDLRKKCEKLGLVCHSTRDQITASFSKVTKGIDSTETHGPGDPYLRVVQEKDKDTNQMKNMEKDVDPVSKKIEKITFIAYKSRSQSTDSNIKMDDVKGYETISEKNQIETNVPTQADRKDTSTMSNSDEKLLRENVNVSIDRSPKMENGFQENGKNKNVTSELKDEGVVFVQDNEKMRIEKENSGEEIKNNHIVDQKCVDKSNSVEVISDFQSMQENNFHKDPDSFLHDLSLSDDDDDDHVQDNLTSGQEAGLTAECNKKINILSNITFIHSPSYTPPHPPDSAISDIYIEVKPRNSNSRRSLFRVSEDIKQTQDAVANIPGIEDTSVHNRGDSIPLVPNITEKTLQEPDNTPQLVGPDSNKTRTSRSPRDGSECIEDIQKAIKNIPVGASVHTSLSGTLNFATEQFDTAELRKCLEEDIIKSKPEDYKASGRIKATSVKTQSQVAETEVKKNKGTAGKSNDERIEKNKRRKEQKHKRHNGLVVPAPKDKSVGLSDDKLLELFGPMTPSPCKAMEEMLEKNVKRDKAKRNIVKFDNKVNNSFKLRDKNEDTNKKVLNKKVNKEDDQKAKGNVMRTRSKSVDENKFREKIHMQKIIIIQPEDVEKCKPLSKQVEENKTQMGLSNFCSNPTYIPNIRDTPKLVFESPNHYIQKKNNEKKEKIKRDLSHDCSNIITKEKLAEKNIGVSKHNLMEEKSREDHFTEKNKEEIALTSGDFLVEGQATKKIRHLKKKEETTTKSSKECSEMEEDEKNEQKVKAKRVKKNVKKRESKGNESINLPVKQPKKTTKQSRSADEKKTRNPSFKIKINLSRKRKSNSTKDNALNKKRKVPNSEKGKELFEETKEVCQEECTIMEEVKQKVTGEESIKDSIGSENPSLSNSHLKKVSNLVEKESKKLNRKERKPQGKGTKLKRAKAEHNDEERKEKNNPEELNEQTEHHDEGKIKNNQKETKDQTVVRLKEEQEDNCHEDIATASVFKDSAGDIQKVLDTNYVKTQKKGMAAVKKFVLHNSTTNTNNEGTQAPVKTIKRITPKRIEDSSLVKEKEEKFKELKSKRELFIENPSPVIGNKRKRSKSEDCRAKKYQKITCTESTITIEEGVMDNGAHTRIKVEESQLKMEVPRNSSPLSRIEQTYNALSRNSGSATSSDSRFIDVTNPQLQPTHEGVFPDIGLTFDDKNDKSLPIINLDSKDLPNLGPVEKLFYLNMSNLSMSGKSILPEGGGDKDSVENNNKVQGDINMKEKELSFMNFLNINQNTSTPIKIRATVAKTDAESREKVNVCNNHNPPIGSRTDLQKNVILTTNISETTKCSVPNVNISGYKTTSAMTSSVSSVSSVSSTQITLGKTLKRDRRRAIRITVLD